MFLTEDDDRMFSSADVYDRIGVIVELDAVLDDEGRARRRRDRALKAARLGESFSSSPESLDGDSLRVTLGRLALPPPRTTPGGGVGNGG